MLKKIAGLLFLLPTAAPLFAQLGGESTYNFLKVNSSVKSAAMGGTAVAPLHNDVSMVAQNPALLDSAMHSNVSLTYLGYPAGISHSSLAAAWHKNDVGTLGLNFTSLNYGAFEHTDEVGEELGNFSVNEFAIGLLYARSVWRGVSLGAQLNTIISQLERYKSYGMAMNIGARYQSPDGLLNATLSLKNIGYQLTPYTENVRGKMPFEVQLAVAKKFEKAPFGLSLSLNDLQSFSVYNSTEEQYSSMDGSSQEKSTLAKMGSELISHVSVGVQIIPSKYFFIMGGYNFRRRNELRVGESSGATGFSFGFGIRLKHFDISYGRATYHAGQAGNHFGLILKL
jgi:hypothetical protein